MLVQLEISQFAIIDHLVIEFGPGMTVLTGETGAGKSIIIDAVNLLAGGRSSTEFIRYGQEAFKLRGLFYLPDLSTGGKALLSAYEIPFSDGELLISREVTANGRNNIRANGVSLTVGMLKALGSYLVDIHGQSEQQSLMDTHEHCHYLDHFGREQIRPLLRAYQDAYQAYKKAKVDLEALDMDTREAARRLDLLKYESDEIASYHLVVGEEESLEQERLTFANYEKLANSLQGAYQVISGSDVNALDLLSKGQSALIGIAHLDDAYQALVETADDIYYCVEDLSYKLRDLMDSLTYDQARQNEVESRLADIAQLKRKYGNSISEILHYYESINQEITKIENHEFHQAKLELAYEKAKAQVIKAGQELLKGRKLVSKDLEAAIQEELKALYMPKAKFLVKIEEIGQFTKEGMERIEFFIATNIGEPAKPLVKVASGGELSRLMLALKTILQGQEGAAAIIFDEVDTGVSGRVAHAIAEKIYGISRRSQVLCISHLPQVAAMADTQLHIEKNISGERTRTRVKILNEEERAQAIAGMSGGEDVSNTALQAAFEMLEQAHSIKK